VESRHKKSPTIKRLSSFLVPEAGLEPARPEEHRIFLPATALAASLCVIRNLWSGLSLYHALKNQSLGILRQASTLSMILKESKLSSGLPSALPERFPRI